jgi:hypothetical protein
LVSNFDHVTIVVTNLDEAKEFFELLGFEVSKSVVISGEAMDAYMQVSGIEADHVTLVIPDADTREEIQLLRYHHPEVSVDGGSGDLTRTGFNHVCFRSCTEVQHPDRAPARYIRTDCGVPAPQNIVTQRSAPHVTTSHAWIRVVDTH